MINDQRVSNKKKSQINAVNRVRNLIEHRYLSKHHLTETIRRCFTLKERNPFFLRTDLGRNIIFLPMVIIFSEEADRSFRMHI